MLRIIIGIFVILHGMVHFLYFGHSRRLFELQSGLDWPDGSWAFSKLFGNEVTRLLASISCALAAIGFVAGGAGLLVHQAWWHSIVVAMAAFSSSIFILFWDGKRHDIKAKGGIAILINIIILFVCLFLLERYKYGEFV